MILAGDIGGTKTNLALFAEKEGTYPYSHLATFPSQKYADLTTILLEFIDSSKTMHEEAPITAACLAIAGPIVEGVCKTTNLPWMVDSLKLKQALKLDHIYLLNDLEANAWAIEILSPDNLFELYSGKGKKIGNRAVISPGTGLGEAGLYWDGKNYHPFATEGGHCEFGPRDDIQMALCHFLQKKFGHASYERILSGPGLINIYQFFKEIQKMQEDDWLIQEFKSNDPAKVITQNALNHKSSICMEALNLFVSILGSEVGNCALKFMSMGGLYLGGGIPPKILPKLKEPIFFAGFVDKGRIFQTLEEMPIHVILDDKASLKGAAHYCRLRLSEMQLM